MFVTPHGAATMPRRPNSLHHVCASGAPCFSRHEISGFPDRYTPAASVAGGLLSTGFSMPVFISLADGIGCFAASAAAVCFGEVGTNPFDLISLAISSIIFSITSPGLSRSVTLWMNAVDEVCRSDDCQHSTDHTHGWVLGSVLRWWIAFHQAGFSPAGKYEFISARLYNLVVPATGYPSMFN